MRDLTADPIRLRPGEMWCLQCGENGRTEDDETAGNPRHTYQHIPKVCMRCGSPNLIPATNILRPDEYVIAIT